MPNPGKKSQVWRYFEEEGDQAKCTLCQQKLKRSAKRAGTSPLANHLKYKHPGIYF